MIIFSSIQLEKALADQNVTRWQKAKYILIPAIFLSMASPLSAFFRPSFQDEPSTIYSVLQLLVMIISIFITYFGIKACFKVNENIDKSNFIERFCILLVPVSFRMLIFFIPCFIASMIILIFTAALPEIHKHVPLLFLPFGPIYLLMYFSLLNKSFLRFSNLITGNSSQPVAQADRKG